jgi:gluconokinase
MNSESRKSPLLFVVMGVSGSGKTSVGREVAQRFQLAFLEGDDYHPRENIEKMSAGIALTNADRVPWIEAIARAVNEVQEQSIVLACSALTDAVRDKLKSEVRREVVFIHLKADPEIIRERLKQRRGHYMRSHMLDSQLAALEHPKDAIEIDAGQPLTDVVNAASRVVTLAMRETTKDTRNTKDT